MKLLNKIDKKSLTSWLTLWLTIFMLAAVPILTNWMANNYQVTLVDLVLPITSTFLTSLILSIIFRKDFRQNKLSCLIGALSADLLLCFNFDAKFGQINFIFNALNPIPELSDSQKSVLFSFAFIVIIVLVAKWVTRLIRKFLENKNWQTDVFANGILIVIGITFLLQFYPTVKTIVIEWPQFFYRPPTITADLKVDLANKPDIYYIVLDRYASQSVLTNQFNFNNNDFVNYLNNNGFSVNPDAHNNYPYTTQSISSTLNAGYNTDMIGKFSKASDQILEPYDDSIRYSSVIEKLKSLGYSYSEIGNWYETSNQAPLADDYYQPEGQLTIFNKQITLNNFSKNYLGGSVWWQFVRAGLRIGNFSVAIYSGLSGPEETYYQLNQLKNIAANSSGGKFVFAHILVPHDPFYFNADGSLSDNPSSDNQGETIKQKYIGQVQYINGRMTSLIDEIKKNSGGKAVIVLQSDEGPYPIQMNDQTFDTSASDSELASGDMTKWSDNNLLMKYGNLAAYDIPAASKTDLANGTDPVNVFRLIFNTYFDGKMSYLPLCYYAYPNGRAETFVYDDITARLTGKRNPACPTE